jgi:hypothetical protein
VAAHFGNRAKRMIFKSRKDSHLRINTHPGARENTMRRHFHFESWRDLRFPCGMVRGTYLPTSSSKATVQRDFHSSEHGRGTVGR